MQRDNGGSDNPFLVTASVLFIGWSALTAAAAGQEQPKAPVIPDKFINLKVLPADITKAQLLPIMKGFSKSSGHRCSYCHDVNDDLSSGDFASDEKLAKIEARELLRLIREVK